MDITIENLIDLLQNAQYVPSSKKDDALGRLEALPEDSNIPLDLIDLVEELLEMEADKAAEAAEADEDHLKEIDDEIRELEDQQAQIIQSDLREDTEAMHGVIDEHKQKVSGVEAEFEKEIEGEVEKGAKSEADDIRKKLGIS